MAGTRDYTEEEIAVVRKSFSGRFALRDRGYFEMALQLGLRVSELLSLKVADVWQYGAVVDEVWIERKHMKGGKAGKASGRVLPIFPETKPHILARLQRLAGMLHVKDLRRLDPDVPLFLSRVKGNDGTRRPISREQAWRICKGIARENELPGKIGTHSTRKTLARRAYAHSKDLRFVQKILGHRSIASTECYVTTLTDREAWASFRAAVQPAAA